MSLRIGRLLTLALPALLAPLTCAAADCALGRLVTLPVSIVGRSALVPVRLNGSELLMLADSGSVISTLSSRTATQLHLPLQPAPLQISLQGIGGVVHAALTQAKRFMLAGVPVRHMQFLVGGQAPFGADGILGENVLGMSDVEYDLPDRVIRLMRPQNCTASPLAYWAVSKPFSVLPLEKTSSPVAIGTAYVNGTAVRVLLDSGAAISILRLGAAERAGIRPGAPGVTVAAPINGVDGRALRIWSAPIASFEIGGEQIRHTRLFIVDADLGGSEAAGGVDMLLGADFFLSHRVYVANSQHKVYFTYTGGTVFTRGPMKSRLNPCLCTPALAEASGSGAVMGSWQRHQLVFPLYLEGVRYPRPALLQLLTYLITQSGGRMNAPMEVTYSGISMDFSTFMPLTTDEVGSTRGIPGTWRAVLFSAENSSGLHEADCEVVSNAATLLSLYSVRHIKAYLPCIPNRDTSGNYGLSFEVFVPRDTPYGAVGGG